MHLHSSTDCGTYKQTIHCRSNEKHLYPVQQVLTIVAHTQEMMLHAPAPTHPSTSRLLHQAPECSRWSLQVPYGMHASMLRMLHMHGLSSRATACL